MHDNIIVYKIFCKLTGECDNGFIGTTTNFPRKKHFHKANCLNLDKKSELYTTIRKYGGWNNWEIVKIDTIGSCEKNAHEVEQKYINDLSYNLSIVEPYRTYVCDICELDCSDKTNYDKHCRTRIHKKQLKLIAHENTFHQEKEKFQEQILKHEEQIQQQEISHKKDMEIVLNVLQKNDDLTTKIIELSKDKVVTHNTNNTNNTSISNSNNKFNLTVFLNETCKDALNLSDFIKQMDFCTDDLIHTGEVGFVGGMSRIFTKGLNNVDANRRPIHCTDLKRETLYIKEDNVWEKEDANRSRIMDAMRQMGRDNIKTLGVWQETHPDYQEYDSKSNTQYMRMIGNAMPGCTDEEIESNYRKIIRNVAREVSIQKN